MLDRTYCLTLLLLVTCWSSSSTDDDSSSLFFSTASSLFRSSNVEHFSGEDVPSMSLRRASFLGQWLTISQYLYSLSLWSFQRWNLISFNNTLWSDIHILYMHYYIVILLVINYNIYTDIYILIYVMHVYVYAYVFFVEKCVGIFRLVKSH